MFIVKVYTITSKIPNAGNKNPAELKRERDNFKILVGDFNPSLSN